MTFEASQVGVTVKGYEMVVNVERLVVVWLMVELVLVWDAEVVVSDVDDDCVVVAERLVDDDCVVVWVFEAELCIRPGMPKHGKLGQTPLGTKPKTHRSLSETR